MIIAFEYLLANLARLDERVGELAALGGARTDSVQRKAPYRLANDLHCFHAFNSALRALVGPQDIRVRLENAFAPLIPVTPEEFSNPVLSRIYDEIYKLCTSQSPRHRGEGRVRATLQQMTDEDVSTVAQQLVDIYIQLTRELIEPSFEDNKFD